MKKIKIIVIFLVLFTLFSCGENKNKENIKDITVSNTKLDLKNEENNDNGIELINQEYLKKYASEKEIANIWNYSNEGKFDESNKILDNILTKIPSGKTASVEDRKNKANLVIKKVSNILNKGNYFYKESESSKQAVQLINELYKEDPDFVDPVYSNYYIGYANEIIRNYDKALEHYNLALKFAPNIQKNNKIRSIILNQKGHLLDLKGDIEEAFKLYNEAYKLDNKNYYASINIARYLARNGLYEKSLEYFKYGLNSDDKKIKSEIYFSLSSIELELNGLKPNIDKSIEYAKLSIKYNPNYPMGYVALARGYYMLNDKKYDNEIEKNLENSLKIYNNNYLSYRYLGLYYFDKKELLLALMLFQKSIESVKDDVILMDNQRKLITSTLEIERSLIQSYLKMKNSDFFIYVNDNLEKNIYLKHILLNQLKRVNYGIFHDNKDNIYFKNILKNFNF